MDEFEIKASYTVNDLAALVRLLRDPERGCPWDKIQTHESIRQNFIEETYEAADAIDKGDKALLCEELGDVMLQVMLHAEIERQSGGFDLDDVATGICRKLVLRHPHIFGEVKAEDSESVLRNWEDLKREEKGQTSGADSVRDVARALPALTRSQKVQKRARYVGFDYEDAEGAMRDLQSEADELRAALAGEGDCEEELGDLLFAAVNVARFAKLDAELALTRACDKFARRFIRVEQLAAERGIDMRKADMETLNRLWDTAKQETVRE
ncbi:MAG: nucleoside triphosphate pyrophosphohydrolase [Oscillospiraceae bacterium]|nr:nucleoside triphosphate pyrophosphohydrolase [Oscillospiraceae bacterium]